MSNTIHGRYLEAEVMGASPLKLVEMMYRAAIQSVGAARVHLRSGKILERSRGIGKARELINELMLSLDHSAGGEISRGLAELYAYMQTRLIEANALQTEPPLEEVEKLLTVLAEAWRSIPAPEAVEPAEREPEFAAAF